MSSPEYTQLANSGTIDLIIYDDCSPEKMPEANTLFFGGLPPSPGDIVGADNNSEPNNSAPNDTTSTAANQAIERAWRASQSADPPFIIDTNRAHPMLQYVDLGTVRIVQGTALQLPSGGTELVRSSSGILIGVAPRKAYQDAVVGMSLMRRTEEGVAPNTDWPIKRSFPVFVLNSLEYLGGAVATAGSKTVKPGQNAILNLANRYDQVKISPPEGRPLTLDRNGQPQLIFTQTEQTGFYTVKPAEDDRLLQLFTVNLFSEQESDITPAAEVVIGAQSIAASAPQKEIVRIETWRWLLALSLVVLSIEWFLYNRRVAV
ncbi:MAG: hypothetical protein R3C53_08175 [Pirellulaceae bacterium]